MNDEPSAPCPSSGLRVVITAAEAEARIATCYKCLRPLDVSPVLGTGSPRAVLPWHFSEEEAPDAPALRFQRKRG